MNTLDAKALQCRKAIRGSGSSRMWASEIAMLKHREEDYRMRSLIVWDLYLCDECLLKLVDLEGVPDDTRRG